MQQLEFMNLTNKVKTRMFYTSVIVFFIFFIAFAKYSRWILEKKHSMAAGFIDEIKVIGRERYVNVKYHYVINGKKYNDDASFNQRQMSYENFKTLKRKWIPIVYHESSLRIMSCLLIFPKDYKDFNEPFPDSLKWILPLIDEG